MNGNGWIKIKIEIKIKICLEPSGLRKKKKPGGDLLSHTLACSTIGDEGLDF